MKLLIPGALSAGVALGFLAGPALVSAGIAYMTLIGLLLICNLVIS